MSDRPSLQTDVLVIGAGIAGLTAANRAAEHGKSVIVLETSTEQQYICNSRYTYGTFHINFSDVMGDETKLYDTIISCTEGFARPDLARSVARDGALVIRWLTGEGTVFTNLGQYHTNVLSPVWRDGAGFKWDGYAGDVALKRLEANLQKRGFVIQRGTRATGLAREKAGLRVTADHSGQSLTFSARNVVIADGGFQANADLVRAHISPAPDRLLQRHGGTAVGDGLRLAMQVGAAIGGLANFYGHLHSRDAMQNPKLWPRPQADDLAAAGIVVDAAGHRVADESRGGITLSNEIARLPDPLGTTVIFDEAIWTGAPGRNHAQPPNPLIPASGGTLHRADTLEALAALAGLPAATVQTTIAAYNQAIETSTLDSLDPPRAGAAKAWPIRTAPFYALPICAAITNTMGGILVNGDAAVIDNSGDPIPGLFAAGSTVGGLDGGPHSGYVGGLIKTAIGYRAAETIAARKS